MRVAESCKEYASRYVQIGQHSWATTYYGWAAQSAILVATQAPTETKGTCHDENLRQPCVSFHPCAPEQLCLCVRVCAGVSGGG